MLQAARMLHAAANRRRSQEAESMLQQVGVDVFRICVDDSEIILAG